MNPPTSAVYASSTPESFPGQKLSKSGMRNVPVGSSGTPRSTLPSAAPRTTAMSVLPSAKVTSQNDAQSGLLTWLRSSMASPRRMSTQSNIISGM